MRNPFLLLAAVVVVGLAAFATLAADTEAQQDYNPNVRGQDGKLVPSRISTAPQYGEIYISDGTGETLTTPTDEVINSATLSLLKAVRGSVGVDAVAGTIRLSKPGLYRASYCATDGTGANTGTQTLELFRKDGSASAAEESPALEVAAITLTAQPWIPLCASGSVLVTAAQAAKTGGQLFDVRATSSTGNMVIKQFRFSMEKIAELDPATP